MLLNRDISILLPNTKLLVAKYLRYTMCRPCAKRMTTRILGSTFWLFIWSNNKRMEKDLIRLLDPFFLYHSNILTE